MSRQIVLSCPYCAATAVFVLGASQADPDKEKQAALYRCSNDRCMRIIYMRTDGLNLGGQFGPDPEKVLDQYPRRQAVVDPAVPEGDIANDFIEAQKCFDIGAARASAAMCRRSLQGAALRLGASPNKRLAEQIDELSITEDLKDWAHQVRVIGNAGAHPDKDGLEDVTLDDAKEAISFTEELYNYVFVMPERLRKLRAAKSAEQGAKSLTHENHEAGQ